MLQTLLILLLFSYSFQYTDTFTNENNYLGSLAPSCGEDNSAPFRIVGGVDASPGDHPWAVYVKILDEFDTEVEFCTGTMLTMSHVLTAYHCLCRRTYHKNPVTLKKEQSVTCRNKTNIKIRVGSLDKSRNGYEPLVEDFKTYEMFNYSNFYTGGDIAIIRLQSDDKSIEELKSLNVTPVCLSTKEIPIQEGEFFTAVGWGRLFGSLPDSPEMLQKVELEIESKENCSLKWKKPFDERTICTVSNREKAICSGDSGGPLMIKMDGYWYQVGTTMAGDKKCSSQMSMPSLFVNIQKFQKWIKKTIESFA